MKKIIWLLIPFLLLCACSGSSDTRELSALQAQLPDLDKNENFIKLSVMEALNYFSFREEDVEEALIYISKDGIKADEVVVVKAVDAEAATRVFTALRDRFEEKKNSFRDYIPLEYEKICRSSVKQSGLYCYYVISDMKDTYESVFNAAFT